VWEVCECGCGDVEVRGVQQCAECKGAGQRNMNRRRGFFCSNLAYGQNLTKTRAVQIY